MKQLTKKFTALFAAFALVAVTLFAPAVSVSAADCDTSGGAKAGIDCAKSDSAPATLFGGDGSIFTTIVNALLFIIGAISVIMLIYGGIRYTTSGGNAASVTAAKNTIMYAIIGLIIAFLAFAIINWILGAIDPSTN